MAQPWAQVAANPAYQQLPPDQQEAARQQYFAQVVAPQISDPSQVQAAKAQFDAQTGRQSVPSPQAPAQPEAAEDPSLFQRVNTFGNNLGDAFAHHLTNAPLGAAQLLGHGVGALADAALPQGNPVRQAIDQTNQNFDARAASREAQYQASTPTNTASVLGATAGEAVPFMLGAPVRGLQAVGDLASKALPNLGRAEGVLSNVGRKILSGGAQGATIAAVQPTTAPSQSFAGEKTGQIAAGSALGGAIPIASNVVGGALNFAKHVTNPGAIAAQNIARVVGSDPATLAKLESANTSGIPGVKLTTAQAAPTPSAVGAEKALGNTPAKIQMVEQQNTNNQARLDLLRRHAGDETTMQAALDARTAAVQPFVQEHLQPATPLTRWTAAAQPLDDALANPSRMPAADFDALKRARSVVAKVRGGTMQEDDAVTALKELEEATTTKKARNAFAGAFDSVDQNMIDPSQVLNSIALTRNTGLGARPTVRSALDAIASTIQASRNTRGLVPADVLDSIRQNANDFLVSPTGKRASPQEALGVAPIRNQITSALEQHAPGYRDYLAAYAKHSEPINTMQAARAILARVDSRAVNSSGSAPLSLNDINQGLKAVDRGRYGISPKAQADLDALQASLKQEGASNSIRFPGSDTAYNVQSQGALAGSLLGPTLGGPTMKTRGVAAALGAYLGGHVGGPAGAAAGAGIGAFINKGAEVINKRITDEYARGMLDPHVAATQIRAYLKANQKQAMPLLQKYPAWAALLSHDRQPQAIR